MRLFFRRRTSEYRVSAGQEDSVAPEETLLDAHSSYSDLEVPIEPVVFRITTGLITILFIVVVAASFRLGVVQNKRFAALALQNKTVNFSISPPRGLIVDRNYKALVSNVASFDLLVVSRELPRQGTERDDLVSAVAMAIEKSPQDLSEVVRENASKSAVFFAATNLPKDRVLAVKTLNPKGFYIITGSRRNYIDGFQFSNLIGYVGKVAKTDLVVDEHYLPSDGIGRMGVEASYEFFLRGEHGTISFTKKDNQAVNREPEMGDTIVLNIDYWLQKKLYSELFQILRDAGLSNAAAVVQNPQTGAVMALVSFPDFDNNAFTDEVSPAEYQRLFQSKSRPLFNRAIGGLYNPGSTIKPLIGMAALQEGVVNSGDTIQDCIQITVPNPFDAEQPYVFKNWRPDTGLFNLQRAIANSCNVYFFTVGGGFGHIHGLGAERIAGYLKNAYGDQLLGIDIPGEENGFIPTPEWKKRVRGEAWYLGDTYNISIGQGDLLVTPLWLNAYVSAIANNGTIYRPYVVERIQNHDGAVIRVNVPQALTNLPFDASVVSEMRGAMRETVISGTARLLQDLPVPAAAKTGTAEVVKGKSINSLFTAFAPFNDPEISITVLVEGSAANEGYAIRTAHNVLKWYFEDRASVVGNTP